LATIEQVTQEDALEFATLAKGVRDGTPLPFIKKYFKIQSESEGFISMDFANEANQLFYYEEVFGKNDPWMVDVLCLKDRKARWTSFVSAVLTSKMICIPGTHIQCITNAEDTFDVVHRFMDGYYRSMPGWIQATLPFKDNTWGVQRKVLDFGDGLTSSFTARTAANPNVSSGETPTDLWFEEYAKFPTTFSMESQSSIRSSAMSSTSMWRGGTVGINGPNCTMFEEIKQYKDDIRQFTYLFRSWMENPSNHLPPGHKDRRKPDLLDDNIEAGINGGPDCYKEQILIKEFPDDGVPWKWRVAWRRSKMNDALLAARNDDKLAPILFQREHPENDMSPWLVAGHSQFNGVLMEHNITLAGAKENFLTQDLSIGGLIFLAWRDQAPGRTYIGGLDLGAGTGGDHTSLQVLDIDSLTFVAELYGNITDPYSAVDSAIKVMGEYYGNGYIVIERNRFPGIGNYAKRNLKYQNVWKSALRPKESAVDYINRDHGHWVGTTHYSEKDPSEEELTGYFKRDFNQGSYKILNRFLLQDMQTWVPDKHTPDRIAAARLCYLAKEDAQRQRDTVYGGKPEQASILVSIPTGRNAWRRF
jgi:hypothetical protein